MLFYIPLVIVIVVIFHSGTPHGSSDGVIPSVMDPKYIFWNNLGVCLFMVISSKFWKYAGLSIYIYNSITFTFNFTMSVESYGFTKVFNRFIKYGPIEILAIAIVTTITLSDLSKKQRNYLYVLTVVLLLIAHIIEGRVIRA